MQAFDAPIFHHVVHINFKSLHINPRHISSWTQFQGNLIPKIIQKLHEIHQDGQLKEPHNHFGPFGCGLAFYFNGGVFNVFPMVWSLSNVPEEAADKATATNWCPKWTLNPPGFGEWWMWKPLNFYLFHSSRFELHLIVVNNAMGRSIVSCEIDPTIRIPQNLYLQHPPGVKVTISWAIAYRALETRQKIQGIINVCWNVHPHLRLHLFHHHLGQTVRHHRLLFHHRSCFWVIGRKKPYY